VFRHHAAAVVIGSVVVLASAMASAQQPTDAARAEALYNEALALTDAGRHADACPKYEASQKLDPALGTQFNLADCYERIGRLAQALALFDAVLRAARAAGKTGLLTRTHARVEELARHVPKLRVVLTRPEPSFDLKIDGVSADAGLAVADGVPVDRGPHEIVVAAPGRVAWKGAATGLDGRAVEVNVPALADLPVPEIARTRPPAMTATAIALGAAGVATVGVGAVFGFVALSKRSDAIDKCGSDDPKNCQSREAVPLWGDAADAGTVSTIAFIAGGALVAAGAVVWFVSTPSKPQKAGLTGAASADAASLVVRGTW
jgi:hypothetical protein